jgi:chromate transport protein ChrA
LGDTWTVTAKVTFLFYFFFFNFTFLIWFVIVLCGMVGWFWCRERNWEIEQCSSAALT